MKWTESNSFRVEVENGIAVVVLDQPDRKVNTLGQEFMHHFEAFWDAVATEDSVRAVVLISGKENNFIAGADIDEIQGLTSEEDAAGKARFGQRVFQKIESLGKPVVAAVHGGCLGGGCELVLACHHRILSDDPSTKIGLPEVRLGILPGFGGTQRLPKVVGLQAALDMILAGKVVEARRALRMGLADELTYAATLRARAIESAEQLLRAKSFQASRPSRYGRLTLPGFLDSSWLGRKIVLRAATRKVKAQTKGHYPAPLLAIESIAHGLANGGQAHDREAALLGKLAVGDVCKNLMYVFRLTEANKKVGRDLPQPVAVEQIGVLGAGVMGGGIAHLAALHDVRVRIKDIQPEALLTAFRTARDLMAKRVKRRRLTRLEMQGKMSRISAAMDYSGFTISQVVIEAIVEDMTIKKNVLQEVEQNAGADTILATNTSSLSVEEMSKALQKPERLVGMHFFNPVHRMPLVEVIRTPASHPIAVSTIIALARRMGKTPVVVRDAPGFLVNRILAPYMNEASRLFEEGAGIRQVDRLMKEFGMPMGPFELMDEVGIDVAAKVGVILHDGLGDRMKPSELAKRLVQDERLGRKNGLGFYVYNKKAKRGRPDEGYWKTLRSGSPASVDDHVIVKRILGLMINEAALCLQEEVVASAEELDLAMIFGTGFPPFRGGLIRYARESGVAGWCKDLRELSSVHGARFAPSAWLENASTQEASPTVAAAESASSEV